MIPSLGENYHSRKERYEGQKQYCCNDNYAADFFCSVFPDMCAVILLLLCQQVNEGFRFSHSTLQLATKLTSNF